MRFQCRQCGDCCRDLLQTDKGILRGLTLLPEETRHFPKEQIKPYLGTGKRPYTKDFKVHAYQVTTPECPFLVENKCENYEERPATCRQFPFSLDPDIDDGILLGVDMNCPAAVEYVDNSEGVIDFPDRESAAKLYQLKNLASKNPKRVWLFDLESQKWVRYDKLD